MAFNFPTSPTDGQVYQTPNNLLYQYNGTYQYWKYLPTSVLINTSADNVGIIANGAFAKANTAGDTVGIIANSAYVTANAAFAKANTSSGGDTAGIIANAAFTQANTVSTLTTSFRNRIINPNFMISQRYDNVATSIANTTYWADRWVYLSDGTNGTCTGNDVTLGAAYRRNGKITIDTGNIKFGCWQIIESINCTDLRSSAVTVSMVVQTTDARVGNMKIGLVEYTGTADNAPSDPTSNWGADGVTPTLKTSFTFLNTPANINATTSPVRYAVAGTPSSTANNLCVFFWCDDKTTTAGDGFYITDVQLVPGSTVPTSCEYRSYTDELNLCKRYYQKIGGNGDNWPNFIGYSSAGGTGGWTLLFPVPMRVRPTGVKNGSWSVSNSSQPNVSEVDVSGFCLQGTATILGVFQFYASETTMYLSFNAEL